MTIPVVEKTLPTGADDPGMISVSMVRVDRVECSLECSVHTVTGFRKLGILYPYTSSYVHQEFVLEVIS